MTLRMTLKIFSSLSFSSSNLSDTDSKPSQMFRKLTFIFVQRMNPLITAVN